MTDAAGNRSVILVNPRLKVQFFYNFGCYHFHGMIMYFVTYDHSVLIELAHIGFFSKFEKQLVYKLNFEVLA
jgi:hypothetical protein